MSAVAPAGRLETSWASRALAALIASAAVYVCVPAVALHSFLWSNSDFFGHAYAIPVVALMFAYERRRAILWALRALDPPAWGGLVACAAFTFEVLMVLGDVRFAAGLGVPLVLAASAYAIGGPRLLRPLALPIGFLALMIPPPGSLTEGILVQLKLFVTHASVELLRIGQLPILANGNQIEIPGDTLFVADACSGLISIVTLIPLAAIVAVYLSRGVWRRIAVVASVVPIAIAANLLRVMGTIVMVVYFGPAFAEGMVHEGFGLATSVVGTLSMIAFARALR